MLEPKPAQPTTGCARQPSGDSSSVDCRWIPWGSVWAVGDPLALCEAPVWLLSCEGGLQAVAGLTCRSLSLSLRFYCMDILQPFFRSLMRTLPHAPD